MTPQTIICALLACVSLQAQQANSHSVEDLSVPSVFRESGASSLSPPTTARILGNIPDGTPPPPQPPKPPFIVAQKDIVSTTTHQQGGRTITLREINPIVLPPPPAPPPVPAAIDPAFLARIKAYRATHPRTELLCLGATVYRSKNLPPRTLVRYWSRENGESVTFWSSADFALLSGIHTFVDSQSATHSILMAWGNVDIDRIKDRAASGRGLYQAPEIPALPSGNASFVLAGKSPTDPSTLIPIQSLHDLYNREYVRLKTAYQGREHARTQREAELKAHPPKPKDIVLNYWRIQPAIPAAKGGAK